MSDAPRLLCAVCLYALNIPVTFVEVMGAGRIDALPGLPLFEKAKAAVDAGGRLIIDNNSLARLYADTTIRGTAVCWGHTHQLLHAPPRTPFA